MKVKVTNNDPVPMEVLRAGVVLKPGESIEIDVPDTDDKPEPAAKKPAGAKGEK